MIKITKQGFRFIYIYIVLARNGVDAILIDLPWFRFFRFVTYLNPWHWVRKKTVSQGEAIRRSFEELGPIFVKFGQLLSTRPDILPDDIAKALAQLQDNVPPFSGDIAFQQIERALKASPDVLFASFEKKALASASIAQVHAATLHDGRSVVIKVLRPQVKKQIQRDVALMKYIARWLERYWKATRQFRPYAMVKEFEQHILDELNLQREGANAAQLRRNFKGSSALYIPEIIWEFTRPSLLVMERIEGIPIADKAALIAANVNIPRLAEKGLEIFFTQVFRDAFFHADMHPGNIFVAKKDPGDPHYICVDFGVMGSLSEEDQRYLAYNLYAFFNRDYRRVAQLHIESGWVSKQVRVEVFESAIRTVCEPIFDKPLHEISFAQLVLQLFHVAKTFDMHLQPQLMLLQKTLFAIEGLGRQLYPELDLWKTGKPYIEDWLKTRIGPKALLAQLKVQLPFLIEQLPQFPQLLYEVVEMRKKEMESHPHRQQKPQRHQRWQGFAVGVGLGVISITTLLFLGGQYGIYG